MRKIASLFVVFSIFFTTVLFATRDTPRVGRSVWRVIRDATPTPIENEDAVAGLITIDVPGNYQLYEDLANKVIQIRTSGVCLDLNGYEITNDNSISAFTIAVNTSTLTTPADLSDIKIFNGRVRATADQVVGIFLRSDENDGQVSKVLIEDVTITDCEAGVGMVGSEGYEVTDCELVHLDLVGNKRGVSLRYADENIVRNCCASYSTEIGFDLDLSEGNIFQDCCAFKTVGDRTVSGFKTDSGKTNLFENCVVKKTITEAWEFCNKAHGFLLTGTEEKTKIIECIVNEVDMTSTISAVSYGIHLEPTLLAGEDLLVEVAVFELDDSISGVTSVAWSPDSRYFAAILNASSPGSGPAVFGFAGGQNISMIDSLDTGNTLLTSFENPDGNPVNGTSIDWSPDGNSIVTGDAGGFVRTYDFDGSSLVEKASLNVGQDGPLISSVQWSPDGKHILVGITGKVIVLNIVDQDLELRKIAEYELFESYGYRACWSPDGRRVSAVESGGGAPSHLRVFNFDGRNLVPLHASDDLLDTMSGLAYSPNGKFIATGNSSDLYIFSSDDTSLSEVFHGTTFVGGLDWSPDGKYVAFCYDDILKMYGFDGDSASVAGSVAGDFGFTLSWSACGKWVVTGSGNIITISSAMYGPEHCFIRGCSICDVSAYGEFVGTGITAGGTNCFVKNSCCNNEVDFSFGIPNVFYGKHNDHQPFDNWATQRSNFLLPTQGEFPPLE